MAADRQAKLAARAQAAAVAPVAAAGAGDEAEGGKEEARRLQHLAWDYKAKADPYGDDDYVRSTPHAPACLPACCCCSKTR